MKTFFVKINIVIILSLYINSKPPNMENEEHSAKLLKKITVILFVSKTS